MSDAVIFEPIPYRSAIRENCTHIIAVRTRAGELQIVCPCVHCVWIWLYDTQNVFVKLMEYSLLPPSPLPLSLSHPPSHFPPLSLLLTLSPPPLSFLSPSFPHPPSLCPPPRQCECDSVDECSWETYYDTILWEETRYAWLSGLDAQSGRQVCGCVRARGCWDGCCVRAIER